MGDRELLDYVNCLDRSLFIDNEYKEYANLNQPLPIGYGQTISQPSLVLEMTRLLSLDKSTIVLEIGTGSGYQTALLAQFSEHVYTMERIPELGCKARKRLEAMGYANITYQTGDGSEGWREHAPYDRIIVTAAAEKIPVEFLNQLNEGGIMIIPVGPPDVQELQFITKGQEGEIFCKSIEKVRFVEMKGKYGWTDNNQAQ